MSKRQNINNIPKYMPTRININNRTIPRISIPIQTLRIIKIRNNRISLRKPSDIRIVIPGLEVVIIRYFIPLFAGKGMSFLRKGAVSAEGKVSESICLSALLVNNDISTAEVVVQVVTYFRRSLILLRTLGDSLTVGKEIAGLFINGFSFSFLSLSRFSFSASSRSFRFLARSASSLA